MALSNVCYRGNGGHVGERFARSANDPNGHVLGSAKASGLGRTPTQILTAFAKSLSPHSYRGRMKSDWVWIA
jgi:hypothetical protein